MGGVGRGALGAIVLADTRRLEDCFDTIDFFEQRDIPFVGGELLQQGAHPHAR